MNSCKNKALCDESILSYSDSDYQECQDTDQNNEDDNFHDYNHSEQEIKQGNDAVKLPEFEKPNTRKSRRSQKSKQKPAGKLTQQSRPKRIVKTPKRWEP